MVGAVIMSHGDDNGLILPPKIAPLQVVVVPIWRGDDPKDEILAAAEKVREALVGAGLSVKVDARDNLNPGHKFHEWELLGVPLRIELGPKDLAKGTVVCASRLDRAKTFVPMDELPTKVPELLDGIQQAMFDAALARREAATVSVESYDELKARVNGEGGFVLAHWCGDAACEAKVQEETKATIRCIAFDQPEEAGRCIICDGASPKRAHFAKAY